MAGASSPNGRQRSVAPGSRSAATAFALSALHRLLERCSTEQNVRGSNPLGRAPQQGRILLAERDCGGLARHTTNSSRPASSCLSRASLQRQCSAASGWQGYGPGVVLASAPGRARRRVGCAPHRELRGRTSVR
jgi:hypothetical protein